MCNMLLSLQEREYIRQEARAVFRQHKNLASPAEIEAKVGGSSSSSSSRTSYSPETAAAAAAAGPHTAHK
jgi:hypothetical protein